MMVCEEIDRPAALQQGDIFEWLEPPREAEIGGVVVTADCDLQQRKHRGRVSYVPLVSLADYLRIHYLPHKLGGQRVAKFHAVQKALRRAASESWQGPADESSLLFWLGQKGIDGIVTDIGLSDDARSRKIREILDVYQSLVKAIDHHDFQEQIRSIGGRDKLVELVTSLMAGLPGDTFFIDALDGNRGDGFIALLRDIAQISEPAIALDVEGLHSEGIQAKRISVMKTPFRYRLTQLLASVFSDIGLPDTHKVRGQEMAGSIVTTACE